MAMRFLVGSLLAVTAACTNPATTANPSSSSSSGSGGCVLQSDCAADQLCAGAVCRTAPRCALVDDWPYCHDTVNGWEAGLGRRAACVDDVCRVLCVTDDHCREGELCTDFGQCVARSDTAAPEAGGEARHPLKAGFGRAVLKFPLGFSLGGFSSRVQPGDGQYSGGLAASRYAYDVLDARALLLDNGESPLLLLRLPVIFIDMSLHERVARALQEHTGKDWRDHLVISATHTHSGPARLWPLPAQTLLPLGLFGIGDFSDELHGWLADSLVDAAKQAIDNTFDAKLGWRIVEGFDEDDQVGSDRRGVTPPFDDNRTLLLRIDDTQGNPRVALFSYGAHGTLSSNNGITADALGGAERQMEEALGIRTGTYVPAMFLNQNSGSMSPRSPRGHDNPQAFERHGLAFVQKTLPAFMEMTTSADIPLASRTTRFAVDYHRVGYTDGEWNAAGDELPLGGELFYGGVQCFGSFEANADYSDYLGLDEQTCLGLHSVVFNKSPTLFLRTQITALKIAGLTAVTMPGELTMELSWQVLRTLRDRFSVDPLQAWTFGYAQDHHLYLMPDILGGEMPPFPGISLPMPPSAYPERAFSILRGEYEASLSPWGARGGDFYVKSAATAFERLSDENAGGPDAHVAPLIYSPRNDPPFTIAVSNAARVGTIVTAVPSTVKRLETIEFAWVGGHPGAEATQVPLVTLQKQGADNAFSDVMMPSHAPVTNHAGRMLTRVRENGDDWEWVVRWEELASFPVGTYRFHVEGHAQTASGRTPYTVDSTPFTLAPIDAIIISVTTEGRTIRGTIAYPAGGTLSDTPTNQDLGKTSGSFRMRHPEVPVNVPAPLEPMVDIMASGITIALGATAVDMVTVSTVMEDGLPVTRFEVPVPQAVAAGMHQVTVDVTDAWGNTGAVTQMVEVP